MTKKYDVKCGKCGVSYSQTGLEPKRCASCGSEALAVEIKATGRSLKPIFKIGAKKGISVYGLQRWPVTLYAGQWLALLEKADELKAFIETNKASLEWKSDDGA